MRSVSALRLLLLDVLKLLLDQAVISSLLTTTCWLLEVLTARILASSRLLLLLLRVQMLVEGLLSSSLDQLLLLVFLSPRLDLQMLLSNLGQFALSLLFAQKEGLFSTHCLVLLATVVS
jgi:hypothetical protein